MPRKDNEDDPLKDDPTVIKDDTQFPDPQLYFQVFDSEKDEPESKYRSDVFKLYERWQKKYGRRWPENGMNTEDLVWLYEEAYKDEANALYGNGEGSGNGDGSQLHKVNNEQELFPGEFITDTDEIVEEEAKKLSKLAPVQKKDVILRAKEELENANWVTDEFESEEYEMGNLEQLYDTYLWDADGNPTIMPSDAPAEELGEESENWDDFYGALRPRGVLTEEVREALWATDEFESDEDNTESEWEPEYVGAGLGLKHEDPINPQWSLRHSNHPLAPFPGEALKWSSFVYDDGTTYEGLTRDAIAHGMGVMTFGNGTGGGFHLRETRRGDKYEGEFQVGYAHGLGQFTSPSRGEVYIGEFFAGQRHGCGIKVNMTPFYYLLERGVNPVDAYRQTYDQIMRNIEFRTWYRGQALGSDYEDENVLFQVKEDFENPWNTLIKNSVHEAKLREWKSLTPEEKAAQKMVEVLDAITPAKAMEPSYIKNEHGEWEPRTDGEGNWDDGEGDSIDLMVGNTTDGGLGFGWRDADMDSDAVPFNAALDEQVLGDVLDDRGEESEDKEMVLGDDIVNPVTGLSLRDYLDGREAKYNELIEKVLGVKRSGPTQEEMEHYIEQDKVDWGVGKYTEELLVKDMHERDKADMKNNEFVKNDSSKRDRDFIYMDTETRFETESDMMELCDLAEILGTIDEAQEIVTRARMWRWKPYGEVTIRFAQDAIGAPAELMQDPLHYPHGTKFMAPGPLGQCHPLPDDVNIRLEMARVAHNYKHVYNMYNFDYDPAPGSAQYLVDQRMRRAHELNIRRLQRMIEGAVELGSATPGAPNEQAVLAAATSDEGSKEVISTQRGGSRGPLASMTMTMAMPRLEIRMGRASRVVLDTLKRAAKHASTRPRLARPQRKQNP